MAAAVPGLVPSGLDASTRLAQIYHPDKLVEPGALIRLLSRRPFSPRSPLQMEIQKSVPGSPRAGVIVLNQKN
jgi:hypothetical protein